MNKTGPRASTLAKKIRQQAPNGPRASTPALGEATHGSAGEDARGPYAGEDACAPIAAVPGPRASTPAKTKAGEDACAPNEDACAPENHSRGYLPHIENKTYQAITFRLNDSVPRAVIDQWKAELHEEGNDKTHEKDIQSGDSEAVRLRKLIDEYEDMGYGECLLTDEKIAQIVKDALFYHDGKRYRLLSWCIMPNHVHVVIEVLGGFTLSTILQGWKSYTAHVICKVLGRKGRIWMPEYFDRYIRSDQHLKSAIDYVENNPVNAGLVATPSEWRFGSAGHNWTAGVPACNATRNAGVPARIVAGEDACAPSVNNVTNTTYIYE